MSFLSIVPSPLNRRFPHWIISANQLTCEQDLPPDSIRRIWNNCVVAVKVLPKTVSGDDLFGRLEVWQSFGHPHVLQLFGGSPPDADPLFVVTQLQSNGNVNEFLAKHPEANRSKIVFEAALGMQYLHGRGLVHGGLRPSNILISEHGQACIADCGMIELVPSENISVHRYFSPEAWKGTLSQPSDVFAFSMSAYEILTSVPPWGVLASSLIYQLVVRENERPDRPEDITEKRTGLTSQNWNIIEESWHKDPRQRPTFDQIIGMWQFPSSPESDNQSNHSGPPAYERIHPATYSPTSHAQTSAFQRSRSQSTNSYHVNNVNPPGPPPPTTTSQTFTSSQSSSSSPTNHTNVVHLAHPAPHLAHPAPHLAHPAPRALRSRGEPPMTYPSLASLSSWSSQSTNRPLPSIVPARYGQVPELSSLGHERSQSVSNSLLSTEQGYGFSNSRPLPTPKVSIRSLEPIQRVNSPASLEVPLSDAQSMLSDGQLESQWAASSVIGTRNPVLIAGAFHAEVTEGRKRDAIDDHLTKIYELASQSDKDAERLVTAGVIPSLILLLKARAADGIGLEIVLITLGVLAHDPISANIIFRTHTAGTLIEIFVSAVSSDIAALSVWCINRMCRSAEVAEGLIKQDLASVLIKKGITGARITARLSAWCLGSLIRSDALAETLVVQGLVRVSVENLRNCSKEQGTPEEISAAIYAIARLARTIKISKALARAGCVEAIVNHLNTSEHPQVLLWSAHAIGCLMRPNSSDMSKILLEAGAARGLARLPRVIPTEEVEPLASFAFAIQRFSCAEWGGGTRKALVQAGVVDSLLAALRTAADVPFPKVHTELALAVSFLGDVGGAAIRKEIVNAGGIIILKKVASAAMPEVAKVCNMAITSITGNLWSRNAASAKTAMSHNWNGGCPDYQPVCPFALAYDDGL